MKPTTFVMFALICVVFIGLCVLTGDSMPIVKAKSKPKSNRLDPGDRLNSDEFIASGDGVYELWMQGDCNLVIYKNLGKDFGGRRAQAYSNTQQKGRNCFLQMQADGNLVVYAPPNIPLWYSNTQGHPGAYAVLLPSEYHGHLVIYSGGYEIWTCLKMPVPCVATGDR